MSESFDEPRYTLDEARQAGGAGYGRHLRLRSRRPHPGFDPGKPRPPASRWTSCGKAAAAALVYDAQLLTAEPEAYGQTDVMTVPLD